MWRAPARATLFEKNDVICLRIEEASIIRDQPRAWSTMQKHDGFSVGVSTLFVIELVNVGDSNVAAIVRFGHRVKSF